MFRPLHTLNTWAATLAVAAFFAVSPARSAPVDECEAYAGTITTDSTQQCLVNGSVTLIAQTGGDAVIPAGYQIGYVLTSTNGLAIEQVGPDPSFTVSGVNIWRIHSIVYDPATLDFAAILDLSHAYQLQDLLVQGGGSICASLNISGAFTKTTECPDGCEADAGTISAMNPDQCLVDGLAQLETVPDGNTVAPPGYSVLHVLTSGTDLLITAVGPEPSFSVDEPGLFTIHTLVFDPATLDLSGIVFGETSGFEIAALLQQGGGPICGSLDAAGAQFQVADCDPVCEANAGTLTAVDGEVCRENGIAHLDATPNGDALVPNGFSVAYILARTNGVIENVEPITLFEWPLLGEYVIHTLVYDPFTLDPFGVQLGTTNASEINSVLFQGGGTVCGSLDLVGAPITVIDCAPPCDEYAGVGGDRILCFSDPIIDLFTLLSDSPDGDGTWFGPAGEAFSGTFNPAADPQGVYVYFVTDGPDCPGDTAQLVISLIECPGPCDAFAGADASVALCTSQASLPLGTLLDGDAGGSWTTPENLPFSGVFNPATDAAGTYTYVVGASDECDGDTAVVSVSLATAPDAGASSQFSLCDSDAPVFCLGLLGGTPDEGGTWTGPNGAPFSGTFDPAVDLPGVYTYIVSGTPPCADDQATLVIIVQDCCDAGESAEITVCFTDPPFSMIDPLGGDPCPGGSWTDPANQSHSNIFNAAIDASGVYTYTVPGAPGEAAFVATLTVSVIECPNTCEADAGTISNEQQEPCLENGSALIVATPNGDAVVPAAYETLFVLTSGQGLVIIDADAVPFFTVSAAGLYTIHTLVYDPNTLDISTIEFGTTSGGDVNALLIQGGGNICASLDVAGAQFFVSDCTDPCSGSAPDAGIGGDILRCDADPVVDLFVLLQGTPDPAGAWTAPDGSAFSGLFDPASSAPGVYVYTVFDLLDCEPDTAQINISVIDCPEANVQLMAWPNPAVTLVSVRFPAQLSGSASIDVTDALGRSLRPFISITGDLITVDVSTMPAGTYTLRAMDGGKSHFGRFARARE